MPELRIVDDALLTRVRERQQANIIVMPRDRANRALNRLHRKTHPLSGIMLCGCRGGAIAITAKGRYGCSQYRAFRICTNSRTIRRVDFEDRVFEGLRSGLLNSKYLDAFTEEFQREVTRLRKATVSELQSQKKRLNEVNRQIKRIVDHVVNGTGNKSITDELTELELEQSALESSIKGHEKSSSVIPI